MLRWSGFLKFEWTNVFYKISEGKSESSQGSNDEEERGISTAPSATSSNGRSSFASWNASSAKGKD